MQICLKMEKIHKNKQKQIQENSIINNFGKLYFTFSVTVQNITDKKSHLFSYLMAVTVYKEGHPKIFLSEAPTSVI